MRVRFVVLLVGMLIPIASVSAQECPEFVGRWEQGSTPGSPYGVAASDGYVYVADADGGLRVIDFRTPSAPVEVGQVDIPGNARGVAVSGTSAYVLNWDLWVVDVEDPTAPVVMGSLDLPGFGERLVVADGYAYVAAATGGLRVIDVSDPSQPVEIASLEGHELEYIAVSDGYAYATGVVEGLVVIDVRDPWYPSEVSSMPIQELGGAVAVSGAYAYVAGKNGGFYVFDVSVPSNPVEVGFVDIDGERGVAVSGSYAYAVEGGLQVIDVSTPSAPAEVGSAATQGLALDVTISDGLVFVADSGSGVDAYLECAAGPTVAFIPAAAYAQGAQGAFFQTDGVINNTGTAEATVTFGWLPRGQDNSDFLTSDPIVVAPGQSLQFENILNSVFGAEPDVVGALVMTSDSEGVIGMSRTYNIPGGKVAGTFGQALPAVPADQFIPTGAKRRIVFMSENSDFRANVGCVNGLDTPLQINIELFDAEGTSLEIKTMDLAPWSSDQINRVFRAHGPVNGHVDVWTDTAGSSFYCYGSVLDNETSDPTTVLPQVPVDNISVIPAAAFAAGAQGAFFQTDLDLNNVGSELIHFWVYWMPRGGDSGPVRSDGLTLGAGMSIRYENVLAEIFELEPDSVGVVSVTADSAGLLAMSRTYNIPGAKVAGTFGQALPGIFLNRMIPRGTSRRIIFMNENDDTRANLGCVNLHGEPIQITIDMYDEDGQHLETKVMELGSSSNDQINRLFRNYAPVNGYVDISAAAPGPPFYCYGSVLDNVTSDPTTVLPQ